MDLTDENARFDYARKMERKDWLECIERRPVATSKGGAA
jgi:hypothetical protein